MVRLGQRKVLGFARRLLQPFPSSQLSEAPCAQPHKWRFSPQREPAAVVASGKKSSESALSLTLGSSCEGQGRALQGHSHRQAALRCASCGVGSTGHQAASRQHLLSGDASLGWSRLSQLSGSISLARGIQAVMSLQLEQGMAAWGERPPGLWLWSWLGLISCEWC